MSLEALSNGYAAKAKEQWTELVHLATTISDRQVDNVAQTLSRATGTGKPGLKKKLEAIRWAYAKCKDTEPIIRAGQEVVLSKYIKSKRAERVEGRAVIKWEIAPELRELVREQVLRVGRIAKLRTSDDFWNFMHAQMQGWDEEFIKHEAGLIHASDC